MPRLRNIVSSLQEDRSVMLENTAYPSRRSQAQSDPCTPIRGQGHICIPTPSPSPASSSLALSLDTARCGSQSERQLTAAPKRNHNSRTHPPDHIPRPRNAFILFRSHALESGLVSTIQQNHASCEIARIWRTADEETRKKFEELAAEEKRRHKEAYPDYKYAPKKISNASQGTSIPDMGCRTLPQRTTSRFRTAVNKNNRALLTPDSTPEPSIRDVEDDYDTLESDELTEDTPLFNMFPGIIDSLPKTASKVLDPTQPQFSLCSKDEWCRVDERLVPCLASSIYYNPTNVYLERTVQRTPELPAPYPEADEFVRRALRPSAPLWHHEARGMCLDELDFSLPGSMDVIETRRDASYPPF